MPITNVYSDQSRQLNWYVRQATDVTMTITVTENSAAFDISSYTYVAEVFRIGNPTAILSLTQGSGITNGGASGIITLTLTDTQTNLTGNEYFWRLRTTAPTDYLWLNGIFTVNDSTWDGNSNSSASLAVTVGNNNIDLAITIGGADSLAQLGTTLQTASADTPLDADTFWFYDVVDSIIKSCSWTNIKATLKTYFDTLYVAITNSATTITDGASISLTTAEHTLTTAQATISVTDSYAGTYSGLKITLSGITSCVLTFVTGTALCVFNGTESGDNTMSITGVAGDKIEISRKKLGTEYTYIGLNIGQ